MSLTTCAPSGALPEIATSDADPGDPTNTTQLKRVSQLVELDCRCYSAYGMALQPRVIPPDST